MKQVKPIWTINKTVKEVGEVIHTHEVAYEKLYDALMNIGIWSNMKTNNGFEISVMPTDESNMSVMIFIAEKNETDKYGADRTETITLRQTDLYLKEDPA